MIKRVWCYKRDRDISIITPKKKKNQNRLLEKQKLTLRKMQMKFSKERIIFPTNGIKSMGSPQETVEMKGPQKGSVG